MTEAEGAATPRAAAAGRSWRDSLAVYAHRRVIAMAFLGFSAGLPFSLLFATTPFWLREAGVALSTIGYFSWIGLTFSVKFAWAPLVDRLPLPFVTRIMGKRRSWILVAQVAIALGILFIGTKNPATDIAVIAAIALAVAFASATQDVAVDAYRIEAVGREFQGQMAGTYQLGYRIAMLASGAGALYVAEFVSWAAAFQMIAALMLVGIVTVLVISEPTPAPDSRAQDQERQLQARMAGWFGASGRLRALSDWFAGAVVSPFVEFFVRNSWLGLVILALIAFYRISDITLGVMAPPFYVDIGFSKAEVASITKIFGALVTLFGTLLGSLLVARFGFLRPLLLGAVLVAITNLLFAWFAARGEADLRFLAIVISADNLSAGIATASFVAYLASLTNTTYSATQYALFSSVFTFFGKLIAGFSGDIVEAVGYTYFFVYASCLGLPAILLVLYLLRRENKSEGRSSAV